MLLLKVMLQLVWEFSPHHHLSLGCQCSCQVWCCQPCHLWQQVQQVQWFQQLYLCRQPQQWQRASQSVHIWEKGCFLYWTSWSKRLYDWNMWKWGNWCQRTGWKRTKKEKNTLSWPKRQATPVTDILQWLTCYAAMVEVLSKAYPSMVPEFMSYQATIIVCPGLWWVCLGSIRQGVLLSGRSNKGVTVVKAESDIV